MDKPSYVLIAGVLLLALCLAPFSMAHESCAYCHTGAAPVVGNAPLISGMPHLCINCHPDRVGDGEHVIDVTVTSMTTSLPLANGRLTCITCHDPHASSPTLLRIEQAKLCPTCHHNQ